MRILFANDALGDSGGVQAYLAAVMPALLARGHELGLLYLEETPGREGTPAPAGTAHFCAGQAGVQGALAAARAWRPDVAFSHNMSPLEVERGLLAAGPVVKMMHGYFGTCIGGQKAHLFPRATPCDRVFGPACLALYLPRHNGRLRPAYLLSQWEWARGQQALFGGYAAVVTASGHMRREFVRNGVAAEKAHAIPLFSTLAAGPDGGAPDEFRVLFLGRMTPLKGGDLLIRAVARASAACGRALPLTLAGDGPPRGDWEALARSLGVAASFPGWVPPQERLNLFRAASLLAVPSVWPEPFGLVGLEAASQGVPALAFDVGGISEWLSDGVNGRLVAADPPRAEALGEALAWAATHPAELAAMRPHAQEAARRMSLQAHVTRLEQVLLAAAGMNSPAGVGA